MKTADLWTKDCYEYIRNALCVEDVDYTVVASMSMTSEGETGLLSTDMPENRKEHLYWGSFGAAYAATSATDVFLIEVTNAEEPLPEKVLQAIKLSARGDVTKMRVRVVLWGPVEVVDAAMKGPVAALTALGSPDLGSYKTRELIVCLPEDVARSDRQPGCLMTVRKVLLISPVDMNTYYPQMVSHIKWHPALVVHLLHMMKTGPGVLRRQLGIVGGGEPGTGIFHSCC